MLRLFTSRWNLHLRCLSFWPRPFSLGFFFGGSLIDYRIANGFTIVRESLERKVSIYIYIHHSQKGHRNREVENCSYFDLVKIELVNNSKALRASDAGNACKFLRAR